MAILHFGNLSRRSAEETEGARYFPQPAVGTRLEGT